MSRCISECRKGCWMFCHECTLHYGLLCIWVDQRLSENSIRELTLQILLSTERTPDLYHLGMGLQLYPHGHMANRRSPSCIVLSLRFTIMTMDPLVPGPTENLSEAALEFFFSSLWNDHRFTSAKIPMYRPITHLLTTGVFFPVYCFLSLKNRFLLYQLAELTLALTLYPGSKFSLTS
jgi:hypothetical protein